MTDISRAQKLTEVPANRVQITFSPEVRKDLKALDKALRANPTGIDPEVLHMVKGLAFPKPLDLQLAIGTLVTVVRECTKHSEKTNDNEVDYALSQLSAGLAVFNAQTPAVTVNVQAKMRTVFD